MGYYYWACKPSKSQLMNFNSLWSPSSNEELWALATRFCSLIQFPSYLSLSNNKPHWGFSWVAVCLEAWWKKLQGNCMQDAGGGNQLELSWSKFCNKKSTRLPCPYRRPHPGWRGIAWGPSCQSHPVRPCRSGRSRAVPVWAQPRPPHGRPRIGGCRAVALHAFPTWQCKANAKLFALQAKANTHVDVITPCFDHCQFEKRGPVNNSALICWGPMASVRRLVGEGCAQGLDLASCLSRARPQCVLPPGCGWTEGLPPDTPARWMFAGASQESQDKELWCLSAVSGWDIEPKTRKKAHRNTTTQVHMQKKKNAYISFRIKLNAQILTNEGYR